MARQRHHRRLIEILLAGGAHADTNSPHPMRNAGTRLKHGENIVQMLANHVGDIQKPQRAGIRANLRQAGAGRFAPIGACCVSISKIGHSRAALSILITA